MPARIVTLRLLFLLLVGLAGLSGCSLIPDAASDPARFYLLAASTPPAALNASAPSVQVRSVELAAYLRGRPLMVRKGENEIEFRDFARWGEPLDQGVARVLREELLARGAARSVDVAGARRDGGPADYGLIVRVLACEGAGKGDVQFRAVWELTRSGADAMSTTRGDFRPGDLRWDGKSEASLVAQLSVAVSGLAGEIAAALRK